MESPYQREGDEVAITNDRDAKRQPAPLLESIHPSHFELTAAHRLARIDQAGFRSRTAHVKADAYGYPEETGVLIERTQGRGLVPDSHLRLFADNVVPAFK